MRRVGGRRNQNFSTSTPLPPQVSRRKSERRSDSERRGRNAREGFIKNSNGVIRDLPPASCRRGINKRGSYRLLARIAEAKWSSGINSINDVFPRIGDQRSPAVWASEATADGPIDGKAARFAKDRETIDRSRSLSCRSKGGRKRLSGIGQRGRESHRPVRPSRRFLTRRIPQGGTLLVETRGDRNERTDGRTPG